MGRTDDRFIQAAFAMFRNYDGRGGAFGNVALAAKTNDVEHTSVYASLDWQDKMILVVLNKGSSPLLAEVVLRVRRHARSPTSTN